MVRPKTVEISVIANAVVFAAGLITLLVQKGANASPIALCVWAIASWVVYLFLRSIWRGRRWAWWVAVISTAVGLALLPWSFSDIPTDFFGRLLYVAQGVVGTAATLLLLPAQSRTWFRPNNSFKPKPLRGSA
jgi:hypothetical protein